jgi:3-deoxy-D-manno-octulosonic-acid transferase
MALVNGRMSARSAARWRWAGSLVRPALAGFSVVLAQDEVQARRLAILGARDPEALGNLKFAADPLPADEAGLELLRRQIAGRPLWLAASTHPGEEAIVGAAHRALAKARPGLLTIIAPRHAARGPAIAAELAGAGLAVARRSAGEAIGAATEIYLADSMGELGLFYRLAPVALVAGSYRWQGHNPIEPAQLGTAVLSGPQVASFQEIYDRMTAVEAALIVAEGELAPAVDRLLGDGGAAGRSARAFAGGEAAGILQRILRALEPVIRPRGDAGA